MVIRTHYLKQIIPFIGTDVIKVITGIRRCGKSVILEQIRDWILRESGKNAVICYYDLEDKRNERYLQKDVLFNELTAILDKAKDKTVYVFLDEVHDVPEWELTVNSLRKRKNADIYVTGSNSKMLSGELATYITGRYVEFKVTPFSFSEFTEASENVWGGLAFEDRFLKYLEVGGVPFLPQVRYDAQASKVYLEDLYWAILSKDIVRRKGIRDVDLLERIVRFAMTEIGHTFSANSIVRFLKSERRTTTVDTVLAYLSACEEAFVITRVPREDLIGRHVLSVDEKYYVTDLGLRRAIIGDQRGQDIDQVLENVVYLELVRRGYAVTIGRVKEKEVDFVCQKGDGRLYVQVSYMMADQSVRDREFGALESVPDQYDKLVLSLDRVDFSRNGVRHRYLPDFIGQEGDEL